MFRRVAFILLFSPTAFANEACQLLANSPSAMDSQIERCAKFENLGFDFFNRSATMPRNYFLSFLSCQRATMVARNRALTDCREAAYLTGRQRSRCIEISSFYESTPFDWNAPPNGECVGHAIFALDPGR